MASEHFEADQSASAGLSPHPLGFRLRIVEVQLVIDWRPNTGRRSRSTRLSRFYSNDADVVPKIE